MNIDKRYKEVRLIFHEAEHKYNDSLGNDYISTTTIIHKYKPEFDKNYWLRKKSKELGINPKELLNQWDSITKEACDRGTNTHNGLEDGIKNNSKFKDAVQYLYDLQDGEMVTVADLNDIICNYKLLDIKQFIEATNNKYPQIYEVFEKYTNAGYKIFAEIGMFLIDYLISGTIDVLLVNENTNSFVIGDWKTNRGGLQMEAGYYKKDKTQKPAQMTNIFVPKNDTLLPPVNNLPDCNGSTYNLQVSLYAKAVELITGMICKGLWLCHIDSDFELNEYGMPKRFSDGLYKIKDNPVEKTTFYVMPYRKAEVEAILEDRKQQIKANEIKQQFKLNI